MKRQISHTRAKYIGFAAAMVFVLSLVAALGLAPRDSESHALMAAASPTRDTAASGSQMVGMTLNLYHPDSLEPYLAALDEIADMGFNTVQIVTPIFQRDGAAPQVQVIQGPGFGPTTQQLTELFQHAKSLGLRVALMPQVNLTNPRGNEWRGKIQPPRWSAWWNSYETALNHFLDLAVQSDIDVFCVGCELLTTQKPEHLDRWRKIIAHARARFPGLLIYSTNWDSYDKPGFWDQLDAVGISGYWDLTEDAANESFPTDDELQKRWARIRSGVLSFAQSQGRPVLLTELGYPALPWALRDPWNYINTDRVLADGDAQARAYASFIRAWNELIKPPAAQNQPVQFASDGLALADPPGGDPRVAGVFFYEWDPHRRGGDHDTGYGIRGKPAYALVHGWLNAAGRP
jgi:hypothetical protein